MFESLKIKKLLSCLNEEKDPGERAATINELRSYGEEAIILSCEAMNGNSVANELFKELIAGIFAKEHLPLFLELFSSSNGHLRLAAKAALSENLKDISALEMLEGLRNGNFSIRKNLLDLIFEKNDPSITTAALELYREAKDDDALKKTLLSVFEKFPSNQVKDFLMRLTKRCSYWERTSAIHLMKSYNDPKVVDFLEAMLDEKDISILRNVVESLGMLKASRMASKIIPLLGHDDLLLRQKAMEALQKMVNPTIVSQLMHLFKSTNVNTRRAVIEVLHSIHDEQSVAVLIKALEDDDWWVREIATEALSQNQSKSIPGMLQKLLHVSNVRVRQCAVNFFSRFRGTFVLKDLIMLLDDAEPAIRQKTLDALALIKDDRAIPHILKKATDSHLQKFIPQCLGSFESELGNKAIGKMLEIKDRDVIMLCLSVINKHKIRSLLPELEKLGKETQFEVRQQINNTIRHVGGDRESNETWRG